MRLCRNLIDKLYREGKVLNEPVYKIVTPFIYVAHICIKTNMAAFVYRHVLSQLQLSIQSNKYSGI